MFHQEFLKLFERSWADVADLLKTVLLLETLHRLRGQLPVEAGDDTLRIDVRVCREQGLQDCDLLAARALPEGARERGDGLIALLLERGNLRIERLNLSDERSARRGSRLRECESGREDAESERCRHYFFKC